MTQLQLVRGTATLLVLLVLGAPIAATAQQETGVIRGLIVDSESGDPLIGANVAALSQQGDMYLTASDYGSFTSLDGRFSVTVPPGTYKVQVQYMGYARKDVTGVTVSPGGATEVSVALKPEVLSAGFAVEVTADALRSAEASLLRIQQKSDRVQDGMSAELISRTGSSNAGDALKRVTGVTMVGDFTFVRGLGGRYCNTLLNGAAVPSPEPYKGSVPLDLFPAGFLEVVQISKTFTPDLPGDFSGGSVSITAKDFPDSLMMSFSASSGFNSQATFKDMYTYKGGDLDFLGFDDGTRSLPDIIEDRADDEKVVTQGEHAEPEDPGFPAEDIEEFGEAFQNTWSPQLKAAPVNQSYALSIGNQTTLLGRRFGYVLSANYKNDYKRREETRRVYTVGANDELQPKVDYDVESGTNSVLWGAVLNASLRLHPLHQLDIRTMYNRSADDEARMFEGWNDDRQSFWRDYRLRYVERGLSSAQLNGEHHLPRVFESDLNWKLSYAAVSRSEPDNREVIYERSGDQDDDEWTLFVNNTQSGSRHFYDLGEDELSGWLHWVVPFQSPAGLNSKLKIGGLLRTKDRQLDVRRFRFLKLLPPDIPWPPPEDFFIDVTQEPEDLFTEEYISSVDSIDRFEITESTNYEDSYDASQELGAAYLTVDGFITPVLRFVGGARIEACRQELTLSNPLNLPYNPGVGDTTASLDNTDILPSANFVYRLGERTNLRAAYGRTLARPEFRELAPYEFVNYVGGYAEKGNPNLKRSLIDNFDLRYETFPRPGELIAFSVFYKHFIDPIEQVIQPTAQLRISYDNAESADSYGFEVSLRKSLDFLWSRLSRFSVNSNFTWMETEVTLPDRPNLVQTSAKRQLQGQSPYVVNAMLAYDNLEMGASATLLFHIFGRRIRDVGGQGNPDTYEESRPQIDVLWKQQMLRNVSLKLSAKNLLNPDAEWTQGGETRIKYKTGRSYSVGLSYAL